MVEVLSVLGAWTLLIVFNQLSIHAENVALVPETAGMMSFARMLSPGLPISQIRKLVSPSAHLIGWHRLQPLLRTRELAVAQASQVASDNRNYRAVGHAFALWRRRISLQACTSCRSSKHAMQNGNSFT